MKDMFTASITTNVSGQIGGSYSSTSVVEAGLRKSVFEALPADATTELAFELDVSETKAFLIRSDVAVTIKTNDPLAPANIFVLGADESYVWPVGGGLFKDSAGASVNTDISSLHVENAGLDAGTLRVDAFVDPTP